MRWIVGVDEGKRSRGALELSRWLADASGVAWREAFVPVHVLDQEHLRAVLRYRHLDEAVEEERDAVARQLGAVRAGGAVDVEMVRATTVEEGLEEACARHRADGVIVARAAARDRRSLFPLGGVARALLRRLACPVIVVPPDLTAASMGDGPVVALSRLGPESVGACRLARTLAEGAGRDLTIVHVVDERAAGAGTVPPAGAVPAGTTDAGPFAESERALARWISHHRVWPDLTAVVPGEFPSAAVAFAEARRAALVAMGAHPASGVRAALEPKLWRWLAAHASQPVLVVPAPAALAASVAAPAAGDDAPAPDA